MAVRRALEWIGMFEGLATFSIWNIRLVLSTCEYDSAASDYDMGGGHFAGGFWAPVLLIHGRLPIFGYCSRGYLIVLSFLWHLTAAIENVAIYCHLVSSLHGRLRYSVSVSLHGICLISFLFQSCLYIYILMNFHNGRTVGHFFCQHTSTRSILGPPRHTEMLMVCQDCPSRRMR